MAHKTARLVTSEKSAVIDLAVYREAAQALHDATTHKGSSGDVISVANPLGPGKHAWVLNVLEDLIDYCEEHDLDVASLMLHYTSLAALEELTRE